MNSKIGATNIGWMDDLRFYVLFNNNSVISGRCLDGNERLCALELRLRLYRKGITQRISLLFFKTRPPK